MKLNQFRTITVALLLIIILSLSCSSKSSSTTTQTKVKVTKGTISVDITASGNLAFSKTADLAFDISGYVYKILVDVGDSVTEGQVVAEVDPFDWESQRDSFERAVIQAKVSLNSAIMSLEDAQSPSNTTSTVSGAVSAPDPLEVESKEWQVDLAKKSLAAAENELARYLKTSSQIVAPFNGFVTTVNLKGGAEINKGAVAVSIADPQKFKADILVSETDIGQISTGMPATVQVTALSSGTFPAKVTAIAPTATNSSGVVNYSVEIELLSDEESAKLKSSQTQANAPPSAGQMPSQSNGNTALTLDKLKEGYSVTISITLQEKQDVLMLASKAISRQGMNYVVKVPNGDKTELKVVKTGITNGTYTEITEGLSEGQEVIITTTASTSSSSSKSASSSIMGMGGGTPPSGGGGPPP